MAICKKCGNAFAVFGNHPEIVNCGDCRNENETENEIKPNWSKSVFFSMIADSRFTEDIEKEIKKLHNGVLEVLKDKNKFQMYFSEKDFMTFGEEKDKQFRVYYRVEINKKNTRLNDLYCLVNSVKPVYYWKNWGN